MEFIVLVLALVLALGILVWTVFTIVGEISAVTFVPTNQKEIEEILKKIPLKKGGVFLDLGSGDGRVVLAAADKYQVRGMGYEIHPWLVLWSRWRGRGKSNIEFKRESLWKADISQADYIYCYLSPRAMRNLAKKIHAEGKKGLVIISKAFEIKEYKQLLVKRYAVNGKKYYMYKLIYGGSSE